MKGRKDNGFIRKIDSNGYSSPQIEIKQFVGTDVVCVSTFGQDGTTNDWFDDGWERGEN